MGFYIIKTILGQKHQKKKRADSNHPQDESTGGEGDREGKNIKWAEPLQFVRAEKE